MPQSLTIRKQSSGGRGEYEIVNLSPDWDSKDLLAREFIITTRFGAKSSGVVLTKQGGKSRLRTLSKGMHIQRQLAALCILPHPSRDESALSKSLPVIYAGRYVMDIDCDIETSSKSNVSIEPKFLVCRSGRFDNPGLQERLRVDERLTSIIDLHKNNNKLPNSIKKLIIQHSEFVYKTVLDKSGVTIVEKIIEILSAYDEEYIQASDPLPHLLRLAGLSQGQPPIPTPDQIDGSQTDILLRSEQIYRLRRIRGASASKFRKEVQKAYDFRCALCGLRIPPGKLRNTSGGEAAHILPWGDYDLDIVQNGILLCRLHHWAFDNHVINLSFVGGDYFVGLAGDLDAQVTGDQPTMKILNQSLGKIPLEWLPVKAKRPNPAYIEQLYAHYPLGLLNR